MLELSGSNEGRFPISVSPTTLGGKPAKLDGVVTVVVQSGLASFEMVDNSSFKIVSGDPGDTTYLVSGDADLGEGVETITDIIIYHVAGARAKNLGMIAGPEEPK